VEAVIEGGNPPKDRAAEIVKAAERRTGIVLTNEARDALTAFARSVLADAAFASAPPGFFGLREAGDGWRLYAVTVIEDAIGNASEIVDGRWFHFRGLEASKAGEPSRISSDDKVRDLFLLLPTFAHKFVGQSERVLREVAERNKVSIDLTVFAHGLAWCLLKQAVDDEEESQYRLAATVLYGKDTLAAVLENRDDWRSKKVLLIRKDGKIEEPGEEEGKSILSRLSDAQFFQELREGGIEAGLN